jgi:peroxin-5
MMGGLYTSNAKVTTTGNDVAWQNIQYNLDTRMREYLFKADNKYESSELNGLFDKGMELFRAGNLNEAISAFEAVAKKDTGMGESWRMLGSCHCELDNDKVAIECFKRAVEIDPYNIEALRELGTSYVNELNSIRALESLRAWLTHNPRFVGLEISVDAHSDGSLMDEVIHLITEAQAFAPDDPDVLSVLGVLCNVSMDFDCAADCFQRAVSLRPKDYTLLNKLGATLANANQSARAIPIYATALELRPNYARGWLNLGISYANVNSNKEAAMAYLQALSLSPDAK